ETLSNGSTGGRLTPPGLAIVEARILWNAGLFFSRSPSPHDADKAFHRHALLRPERRLAERQNVETEAFREPAQIVLRMAEAARRADLEASRLCFLGGAVGLLG